MTADPREESSTLLSFDQKVGTIIVGPNEHAFHVHLSHLSRTSAFFQAAFKKHWVEGKQDQIKLAEDDATLVNIYLHFIYTGKIPCRTLEGDTVSQPDLPKPDAGHLAEYMRLADLYCFGEKYQDEAFKNAVMDAIVGKTKVKDANGRSWYPTGKAVDIIYNGTCTGSPARKFMVDVHVSSGYGRWVEGKSNNKDFLLELASEALDSLDKQRNDYCLDPVDYDSCDYHTHESKQCCTAADTRKRKRNDLEMSSSSSDD